MQHDDDDLYSFPSWKGSLAKAPRRMTHQMLAMAVVGCDSGAIVPKLLRQQEKTSIWQKLPILAQKQ